jgi:hypothetical protein
MVYRCRTYENRKGVMVKKTVTQLSCDQCMAETGEDVDVEESVSFGYDGYGYALDLCGRHVEDFHHTVQAMIGLSSERSRIGTGRRTRRATPSNASAPPRGAPGGRERLRAIREWARDNGYPDLGGRGRIPQHIMAEYEAAHGE